MAKCEEDDMRNTEVSEFIDSAYIWQERATRAEAEVERLQTLLETFNGECVVCDSVSEITKVQAELVKLRKVADAAREFFEGTGCKPKECKKCDPKYINFCERSRIGQALAELDKEKR